MKWVAGIIAIAAIVALIVWSPWNNANDSASTRAQGNVQIIYQPHPSRNVTLVYAGRREWIDANNFGGIRRHGKAIHVKLAGKEKIIRGFVLYIIPGTHKQRAIKWNGKRAVHLHRKLKLVKGGKKHKVVLKQANLFVHKRGYMLPPAPVKGG